MCVSFVLFFGNAEVETAPAAAAPDDTAVFSNGASVALEMPAQNTDITERRKNLPQEAVEAPAEYRLECFSAGGIYSFDMLEADIARMARNNPDIVSYETIGESVEGRSIYALAIGKGQTHVLITAGIHARETANTPLLMQCLFDFLYAYAAGGEYADILQKVTLIVVPLVNPDGYDECLTNQDAAKKTNAAGVDINRNFPCKYWGGEKKTAGNGYPGPFAGSEPETQAVMALFDRYAFALAADIHSRGRKIFCIKCGYKTKDISTRENPSELNTASLALAQYLLEDIRYDLVKERQVKVGEGGTLTDYAFSRGVPTVTLETLKYKMNRLPRASEIQNEYAYFNWPLALFKLAEFAAKQPE